MFYTVYCCFNFILLCCTVSFFISFLISLLLYCCPAVLMIRNSSLFFLSPCIVCSGYFRMRRQRIQSVENSTIHSSNLGGRDAENWTAFLVYSNEFHWKFFPIPIFIWIPISIWSFRLFLNVIEIKYVVLIQVTLHRFKQEFV